MIRSYFTRYIAVNGDMPKGNFKRMVKVEKGLETGSADREWREDYLIKFLQNHELAGYFTL